MGGIGSSNIPLFLTLADHHKFPKGENMETGAWDTIPKSLGNKQPITND